MKNTVLNPSDRLVNHSPLNASDSSNSLLTCEHYKELLKSEFMTLGDYEEVNEDEYMYRDGFIISYLKKSLSSIKFEIDSWKPYVGGFKVTLFRDKTGFGFYLVVLSKSETQPIDSRIVECMSETLDDSFHTTSFMEMGQTVFKLTPYLFDQAELMRPKNIPTFTLSLITEVVWDCGNYSLNLIEIEESKN
jgi:hypothetical protein